VGTWGVDIISMSFSFTETQKEIGNAIYNASRNADLFLAAASNNKLNDRYPVGYPARHKDVICVNSSAPGDERSTFSPTPQIPVRNFSVIGEHLSAAFPTKLNSGNFEKRQSGTSMATAIMAGIAGLVVEFSRLVAVDANVKDKDRLLTDRGMKAVFLRCMLNQETHMPGTYLHVKPWLLFDGAKNTNAQVIVRDIEAALDKEDQ